MFNLTVPLMRAKICRKLGLRVIPYKVNLHITYSCGSRCKTCLIWKKYADDASRRDHELTASQWKQFFKNLGNRLYWLSISGGEPFMRNDLPEIISSVNSVNLSILSFNTNGQLPEKTYASVKEIMETLPEKVNVFLAISLLGLEKTHNFVSGTKNAYENAERTYEKLTSLRKIYPNLCIERELLVSRHNLSELTGIVADLDMKKIPYTMTFSQEAGFYGNEGLKVGLSHDDKKKLAEMLKKMRIPVYQKEHVIKRSFAEIAVKFFENGKIPGCYSTWSSIRIDPYGNVFPCLVRNEPLGNLPSNDMNLGKTIENSGNVKKIQKEIKDNKCSCWTPCDAYQNIIQNFPWDFRMVKMILEKKIGIEKPL